MKKTALLLIAGLALTLTACDRDVDEDKIRKEAKEAHQLAMDYIEQQKNLRAQLLTEKIRLINDNIEKLTEVGEDSRSSISKGLQDPVVELKAEKELYERMLQDMNEYMDESARLLDDQWEDYHYKLNIVLTKVNNYLEKNKPETLLPEE